MTEPRTELTTSRVSGGGIPPRLIALLAIVALGGVVYVGVAGQSGVPPPAPVAPAATTLAAPPTPEITSDGAPGADAVVFQLPPDGALSWDHGLGIELLVARHRYEGQLYVVDDGHYATVYSVPDALLGEWTSLSLTRDLDGTGEDPVTVAGWDFTMYAAADQPPPMLVDQDVAFDPTDPAELALFQTGYHISVRLAPTASAEHVLLIDLTASSLFPPMAPSGADVVAYSPGGRQPSEAGIGLDLMIGGEHYPGFFVAGSAGHLIAAFAVSERIMNQSAAVGLTGSTDGAADEPIAWDRWLFALPAGTQVQPATLLQMSVVGRSGDSSAPRIMQLGYDIRVRLAAPSHGQRTLTIDIVPTPVPQARDFAYWIETEIVGGTLRVPLEPDDGNSYFGRFEIDVRDVIDRRLEIQAGRARGQAGYMAEQFGSWGFQLKALRGSHGENVPLVVVHAPPNVNEGLAPSDMERVGYTVSIMCRREGGRLFFSVELVIGGLVAPQPAGGA